jgi:hypothetical protein
LSFLGGYTLGQVCHIVQLAMSEKKLLGYYDGAVVPYGRSQSMMKERCAVQQQPRGDACEEAAALALATWESARSCLRSILEEAARVAADVNEEAGGTGGQPGAVPLSNVKRQFRTQFHLELSETTLGHSKLSSLLQDNRFEDICSVRLDGQGYTVIQVFASSAASSESHSICMSEPEESYKQEFCEDEPLCFEEVGEPIDLPNFGPTPGPFAATPLHLLHGLPRSPMVGFPAPSCVEDDKPCTLEFCPNEPLCLEEVEGMTDIPSFGATPGPFAQTPLMNFGQTPGPFQPTPCPSEGPTVIQADHSELISLLPLYLGALHNQSEQASLAFCPDEPLCFYEQTPLVFGKRSTPEPQSWTFPDSPKRWDTSIQTPWLDGPINSMEHNAFPPAPFVCYSTVSEVSSQDDGSTSSSTSVSPRHEICPSVGPHHEGVALQLGGGDKALRLLGEALQQESSCALPTLRLSDYILS